MVELDELQAAPAPEPTRFRYEAVTDDGYQPIVAAAPGKDGEEAVSPVDNLETSGADQDELTNPIQRVVDRIKEIPHPTPDYERDFQVIGEVVNSINAGVGENRLSTRTTCEGKEMRDVGSKFSTRTIVINLDGHWLGSFRVLESLKARWTDISNNDKAMLVCQPIAEEISDKIIRMIDEQFPPKKKL